MPIPLRPNTPMQHGYGPRMMPPRFPGGMHRMQGMPMAGFNPTPQRGGFPPGMGRNQGNKGGGLLAKILGRNKQPQGGFQGSLAPMSRSAPSNTGGLLRTITNPEALNGLLNNTQSVLKTAQQFGPVIQQFQQYVPLVKNLPSLWKLYRGFKDATSEDTETNSSHSESIDVESSDVKESHEDKIESKEKTSRHSLERIERKGSKEHHSIPKLYI
ncbi:VrrA/YqfQ family protein [Bacillus sp. CGMCC 1.16607]|uniref:VrrA/YqfQ family protein n=1 Tax=Bacillus sp. CGMCC 1.16607 TaxID=3351842 RepID=UPI0036396F8E